MGKSLLEVLRTVALDADEQSAFEADPGGYLGQHGYDDVPVDDLTEAVGLMADTLPPDEAEAVGPIGGPTGAGAEGGASWVDALQRLDDPDGASTAGPSDVETTTFGDADFDNGAAPSEDLEPSSEPEDIEDIEGPEADDGPHLEDEVDFGAGSASSASEEAPLSPDAEGYDETDAPEAELDFGQVSAPEGLDETIDEQPPEDDAFNAADDFSEQLQETELDDADVEDLDVGLF